MNAHRSLFFFCGVFAGLALLCLCFPSKGLPLYGNLRMQLPALADVLRADAETEQTEEEADLLPELTPEELLEVRRNALNAERMDEFRNYCNTNAARIYMPDNDDTYLDELWEALQGAGKRHVRILHYGDSQIECDRITSLLRQRFQEHFGGMGVGMVPALQNVPTFTLQSRITPDNLPQYVAYGSADMRLSDRFYGPLARVTHIPHHASIHLRGIGSKDYAQSRRFNRITVITRRPSGISLKTSDEEAPVEMTCSGSNEPCYYTTVLPKAIGEVTIEVDGETDILGIQLDGQAGVSIDNIPMRGSSGRELAAINQSSIRQFYSRENVALIILQFGGNSTPYLTQAKLSGFKKEMKRLINCFHDLAPKAKVLFIGPADMAHKDENGTLASYPILPALCDSIRAAANESGAAFWNMYAAMGGKGSIVRWNNASPQLAGADYIHFTPLGAKKIANLLYETLELYYRFYRFRSGQEEVLLTAEDSAAILEEHGESSEKRAEGKDNSLRKSNPGTKRAGHTNSDTAPRQRLGGRL